MTLAAGERQVWDSVFCWFLLICYLCTRVLCAMIGCTFQIIPSRSLITSLSLKADSGIFGCVCSLLLNIRTLWKSWLTTSRSGLGHNPIVWNHHEVSDEVAKINRRVSACVTSLTCMRAII